MERSQSTLVHPNDCEPSGLFCENDQMVFMLNTFLRRRKDYFSYKFKEWKENLWPTKTENSIKNLCQYMCHLPASPTCFWKCKTRYLLAHWNLPKLDHLKRMTEFGVQGERGPAGFQWGSQCARAHISGKRSERASPLAGSPSTCFPLGSWLSCNS